MKKWDVTVKQVTTVNLEVEAETRAEAKHLAKEQIAAGRILRRWIDETITALPITWR